MPAGARLDHEHAAWTAVLSRFVADGRVDYRGLKARGGPELDAYLRSLEAVGPEAYAAFTREQRLAFWVNAYNAYTVKLVLQHYPIASIRKIGWLPLAAFFQHFIPLRAVGDKPMSLNDIEHAQLRAGLREARIHFAIVCASRSCPPLRSEAYRASAVEAQLDEAARGFVRDAFRNRVVPATGSAEVSRIFKWFRGDFTRDGRTLGEFIAQYAEPAEAELLRRKGNNLGFLRYDWGLNAQ
jgi:hypothetical protein